MAWVKIEHETPDKPEVIAMADILDIEQDAVLGKLTRLWIWADKMSRDGHVSSVTKRFVDSHVGVTGFFEAMRKVGWLSCEKEGIIFPHFERHNGDSAKKRATDAVRQSRKRHADTVTKTLPEKNREDNTPFIPQGGKFASRKQRREAEKTDDLKARLQAEDERIRKQMAERQSELERRRLAATGAK